jgi:plastocyanin
MRRRLLVATVTVAAALVAADGSWAAVQDIQAAEVGPTDNRFVPADVTVAAGDTVRWRFEGTQAAHNVRASSANWTMDSDIAVAGPPVSFTFATPGTYTFECELHSGTMKGTVTVGNPPPPPPPPLSEQPFQNEQPAPTVLEITDDSRPALSRVRASRIARGARVRFRLSEPGSVTVRVKRGRRTVKSRTVRLTRAGSRTVNLRGLRPGGYRIEVLARDLADNRSRIKRARVTVGR